MNKNINKLKKINFKSIKLVNSVKNNQNKSNNDIKQNNVIEKWKNGNNKTAKIYWFNGDNQPVGRIELINQ